MLKIVDSGIQASKGKVDYLWFRVATNGYEVVRCVGLRELRYIPIDLREDPDVLGKMWAALRGLYNSKVNLTHLVSGMYTPRHIGVVQYYGATAEGSSETEASRDLAQQMAAVEAVLANYPQSRLGDPDKDRIMWLLEFITERSSNILNILGHPDPREAKRGLGRDGSLGQVDEDLASQQNEILLRGLAKLRQDFVFLVSASRIGRSALADGLVRMAELASSVASRQFGAINFGVSMSLPIMSSLANAYGGGRQASHSEGESVSDGVSHGWGRGHAEGKSESDSVSETAGVSRTFGHAVTRGAGRSSGVAVSNVHGSGESSGGGTTVTHGQSSSVSGGAGINAGVSANVGTTQGTSSSIASSSSYSRSSFSSHGVTQSQGRSEFESETLSETIGFFSSRSRAHTEGRSVQDSMNEAWGQSHQEGQSFQDARALSGYQGLTSGLSGGLIPGINLSRSFQTEDDVAIRLTEMLRSLESLLNTASAEGGFLTRASLFLDDDAGMRAAEALVPQAFHGPDGPTPVLTVRAGDQAEVVRENVLSFLPDDEALPGDPFVNILWTELDTLLTPSQVAAYTSPALFEEGIASTTQERMPALAFYPDMPGEVFLGHQYSPETGDLTNAPVRLTQERHFHTAYLGDTGYGKSVTAMRVARETVYHWNMRTIVLDFGAGWRGLLNAPGIENRVEIYQLWPNAVRPFRWNPLQIGRYIDPERQWRAFADIFGTISQAGTKRMMPEILEGLRQVYVGAGVLVHDKEVRGDKRWNVIASSEEASLTGAKKGESIYDLEPESLQSLVVHRSKKVGLDDLYAFFEMKLDQTSPRDIVGLNIYQGIINRLNPLVSGAAADCYGAGEDKVTVEELGLPDGLVIIEGGTDLDDFSKAFLLGWVSWQIYNDAVIRRRRNARPPDEFLQLIYEEANKILGGISAGDSEDGPSRAEVTSEQFKHMFRDSRKYGTWLHIIAQSPSEIPGAIISSCNNIICGQLKSIKDRDIVVSHIARSAKGLVDEPWTRYIGRQPIAMEIARFGYSFERHEQEPFAFRPAMLEMEEPTDDEIAKRLKAGGK